MSPAEKDHEGLPHRIRRASEGEHAREVRPGAPFRAVSCCSWHAGHLFSETSASAAKRAWARLIKQVYEVDPLVCPHCGGAMRILAFIEQPEVIEKILTRLALWPASAHSPPAGVPVAIFLATDLIAA
jgi:hypothetical protein